MPSDIRELLASAAAAPEWPLDVEALWRRGRRHRAAVAGGVFACVASLAGLTAALIATSSGPRPAIGAARSCAAPDLSHVSAQWHNASDLVLEGTLNVTNGGTRACLLPNPAQPDGKPSAALVDGSGKPVETTVAGGVIPVERLPPTQTLRLEPGQSGTAVIRWGGTYCGPPLTRVILRWTLANGDVLDRPVTGGVLTCIDTPYYGRGQSSAAISGFTLTTP